MSTPPLHVQIAVRGIIAAAAAAAGHQLAPEMLDPITTVAVWAIGGVIAESSLALRRRRSGRRARDRKP